jgi:chromosome partitioning protein
MALAGKILLVTKLKGGSGATTTCRELSIAALHEGRRVALIDLDGQGGLSRWWNRRTSTPGEGEGERAGPDLLQLTASQIPAAADGLRNRYALTIIDSPPSVHETIRSIAKAADLALIPCRPTVDDLDAIGPIARLLHGVVDLGFVLTQVPPARGSRDGVEALERLASRAAVLGRTTFRADYSRPPGHGSTGFELGGTATREVRELYVRLTERLNMMTLSDHAIMESSTRASMESNDHVITAGKA